MLFGDVERPLLLSAAMAAARPDDMLQLEMLAAPGRGDDLVNEKEHMADKVACSHSWRFDTAVGLFWRCSQCGDERPLQPTDPEYALLPSERHLPPRTTDAHPGGEHRHTPGAAAVDGTDLVIVQALRRDPRVSYSDIAVSVGVSAGTVRNRITRMRATGALALDVWLDPRISATGVQALVMVTAAAGHVDAVVAALEGFSEIGYLATLSGPQNVVAEVFCRDVAHLREVLHHGIHNIDGVTAAAAHLVTENQRRAPLPTPHA